MIERDVRILPVATLTQSSVIEDLRRQLDEADHHAFLLSRENGQLCRRVAELEEKLSALDAR